MEPFPRRDSAWKRAGLALAFVVVCATAISAQTTLGRLGGAVLDGSGAVLPGATITLTNENTNQVQTTVSSENGTYVFAQVPVGSYKVEIALRVSRPPPFSKVTIAVGQEYSLTARLELGGVAESVDVTAGASLVTTTSPEVSSTVLQKQVLDIPLANRDVTNLIQMQPGVQAITNRTNTGINGGRPTWTTVTLDGINIQDNFIRTNSLDFLPNRPTSDNVAEFTITIVGFRRGHCGRRDVGANGHAVRHESIHGQRVRVLPRSQFSANSFFNNASNVAKPDLSRHQFGGRFGGPVKRDRIFFFGYYEGFRQTTQTSQNLTIPANADLLDGISATSARTAPFVRERHAAVGPAARCRGCGPTSSRRFRPLERQQLRRRQLDGHANAEHGRLPVQPDRFEQPRSIRRSASITR